MSLIVVEVAWSERVTVEYCARVTALTGSYLFTFSGRLHDVVHKSASRRLEFINLFSLIYFPSPVSDQKDLTWIETVKES